MIDFRLPMKWLGVFVCCVALSGCFPLGDTPVDEEKDPNYLQGKRRLHAMDYKGAAESFQKALQANPNSAAAHFELAVLTEKDDYVSALYHYDKHLKLRPNSNVSQPVKLRIDALKMELAKTVSYTVVNKEVQRDMERLLMDNNNYKQLIENLKSQLAQRPMYITNYVTNTLTSIVTNTVVRTVTNTVQATGPVMAQTNLTPAGRNDRERDRRNNEPAVSRRTEDPKPRTNASSTSVPSRTYIVKDGDSLAYIARRFGVKAGALNAANPGLDPRRLRPGQILHIPNSTER